jgi:hypothetical protein
MTEAPNAPALPPVRETVMVTVPAASLIWDGGRVNLSWPTVTKLLTSLLPTLSVLVELLLSR